jgi:hypothetical protein
VEVSRTLKQVLLAVAAGLGLMLLLAVGYAVHLVRSLDTPEFKARVLAAAKTSLGTDVGVKEMKIDVLSGVTLRQAVIANPAPLSGNLLTADAFVLKYRFWPLLLGRVHVDEVRLDKPVLLLATDSQGRFNYERLRGLRVGGGASGKATSSAVPLSIVLKRLAVSDATIRMTDARRASLVGIEGADFKSSFSAGPSGVEGRGKAEVRSARLGDVLRVTGVSSPLEVQADTLKLAPIRGRLADGEVASDVSVRLKGTLHWTARLDLDDAQVARLLEEAHARPSLSGALRANGAFEGGAGLATTSGKWHAQINDCAVHDVRLLALLSTLLGLPELANPDFDECQADFVLKGYRLETPTMAMKGRLVRLTGRGEADLRSSALDYDMTLSLARPLLGRIPAKELRAAFTEQPDGFASTPFRVTGTVAEPRTDLSSRIGRAAAGSLLQGGLDKLFGRKKKP